MVTEVLLSVKLSKGLTHTTLVNMTSKKTNKTEQQRIYKGIIDVVSSGRGYVAIDAFDADISISPEYLNTALDGDVVEVVLREKKEQRGQQAGIITKVLERAKINFVGVLEKKNGKWFLVPDNPRMYADIELTEIREVEPKEKSKARGCSSRLSLLVSAQPGRRGRGRGGVRWRARG